MDAIFGSSRAEYLYPILYDMHPQPENIFLFYQGGKGIDFLQHEAYSFLRSTADPTNCHIYFVAGLCDISYKDKVRNWGGQYYEEVIFNESPDKTLDRMSNLIDNVAQNILAMAAKPCFSTIVPSNLRIWNNKRLKQNKTDFLLHHNYHEDMQDIMNRTILDVNKYINATNTSNNMVTPDMAKSIVEHRSGKRPRFHYDRFGDEKHPSDGVHPTPDLSQKWAKHLQRAINKNRRYDNPIKGKHTVSFRL